MENSKAAVQSSLVNVIRHITKRLTPKEDKITTVEIDALSQLCIMGVMPSGEEEPRKLLSQLSDPLLDHLISHLNVMKANPITGKICQFFLVEWCYRNGYLTDDWIWQWDNPNEGHVAYNSRVPLDQIALPAQKSLTI